MRSAAQKCGLQIDWYPMPIGHQAYPKGKPNAINPHPILRKHYDLFANIRPAKSLPGLPALYNDVDLVIVRENNEGMPPDRNMYMGNGEFRPTPDMTIGVRVGGGGASGFPPPFPPGPGGGGGGGAARPPPQPRGKRFRNS